MEKIITNSHLMLAVIVVVSIAILDCQAQDIRNEFKCVLTDQKTLDLRYNGTDNYKFIGEVNSVSTSTIQYTVCRSLGEEVSAGYIIYGIKCSQLGDQISMSVDAASVVDRADGQALDCKNSTRAVPPLTLEKVTAVTVTENITTSTYSTTSAATTTVTMTTTPEFNMSSLVALQVLDESGLIVDHVVTTQLIQLRVQALTTTDYQPPLVNRCWYSLASGEEDYYEDLEEGLEEEGSEDDYEEDYEEEEEEEAEEEEGGDEEDDEEDGGYGELFVRFGCALRKAKLLESKRPVFTTNGPLDVQTMTFNLQTLYDLDFKTLTFTCSVDLCTQDQYCLNKCPAERKTYRVPPGETIDGIVSTTIEVEKRETTTTTVPTKPTTENPFIIRNTERPPPPPPPQKKSGMEKTQPYLVIVCIVVGCIAMFLLCFLTFRIVSSQTGEPDMNNPQEPGKVSNTGSGPAGQAAGNHMPGNKMLGPSPPPGYSTGTQSGALVRGRTANAPVHNQGHFNQAMTQPLITPSPTRGRSTIPQQTELLMSPARLSDAYSSRLADPYYKNTATIPSRYQDSQFNGSTIVGGEFYPIRDRPVGQLVGRELYYLPEAQMEHNHVGLLSKDAYRDPSPADKRALGSLLAREAALRQGSGAKRELFVPPNERDGQVQKPSEVGNLISKSLSEYIDRHGVAALSNLG